MAVVPAFRTVLDEEVVGRTYEVPDVLVDPVQATEYAAVACDDPGRYAPTATHPCFVINPAMKVLEELLSDPALGVSRRDMLHGHSDMVFAHLLVPGERVDLRATIVDAGEYGARQAYVIATTVTGRSGRLLVGVETLLAFAHPIPGASGRPPVMPPPALPYRKPPVLEVEHLLDADLPRRYADASGDHNPIHLDDAAARAAGLPGVILHGMSTMAIGCTAAVDGLCGGDARRLRRMRVRFSRPVQPGCRVTYRFHETETAGVFAVTAHADGRAIWKQSVVELH
jgi:acyl dehydratase